MVSIMAKYHINWKGEPGLCTAEKKACPLGGDSDHFDSPESARAAYESAHSSFGTPVRKLPLASDEDVLRYQRMSRNVSGRLTPAELAEADGFDGADVTVRLAAHQEALEAEARNARASAEERPESMGHEIDAQRAEEAAGLSEPRRATKKTAAPARPRVEPTGWQSVATPSPADSKFIKPPKKNDPYGGYMGGRLYAGGKTTDSYMSAKDAAANIRKDIKEAVRGGELPDDVDYSVRMNSSRNGIYIYLGRKTPNGAAEFNEMDQGDSRLIAVKHYVEAMGNQYCTDDSNAQVDYFNSHNRTLVRFRDRWS